MKNKILALSLFAAGFSANAQDTIPTPTTNAISFSAYVETYYNYDFNEPDSHLRPSFLYNHNRHNELNVNLVMVKAAYVKENVRANLALMAGTYAQYNLAAEPNLLQNIYEANVGVRLSKKHNLWIDGGILPSHIGFESAVGKDNHVLTRSILAENSPYYEAGVKVGYSSGSARWYLAAMYLNGWQRIQKVDGNQTPAFGTQVTYKPSTKSTFNWSSYVGNEQQDSIRKWRYFNNFYGLFSLTPKINLTAGFDIGVQQSANKSQNYNLWYAPIVILQYKPISKIQMAARAEYYDDQDGVIIATGTNNGFKTYGFSANFDYLPSENVIFRIEARTLNSKDAIFTRDTLPVSNNIFLTSSLAISF